MNGSQVAATVSSHIIVIPAHDSRHSLLADAQLAALLRLVSLEVNA
jgi:hypothetical protein